MPKLENVRIVLVSPLYGGNVGSACRAMANMGMRDLALVAPRPLDEGEARMMACHATDILEARREFPTLEEAVADCALVVGTTARRGLYRQHAFTPRDAAQRIGAATAAGPVGLVFGREDRGLTNEELAVCTHLLQIPTTSERSSLNLAQAVMVCAYELFVAADVYEEPEEKSGAAPSAMRERMFSLWRETLLEIGFMEEDKADHMMMGIRRVFARGALTEDDVRIFMGIVRQVQWAARNMGPNGRN